MFTKKTKLAAARLEQTDLVSQSSATSQPAAGGRDVDFESGFDSFLVVARCL